MRINVFLEDSEDGEILLDLFVSREQASNLALQLLNNLLIEENDATRP